MASHYQLIVGEIPSDANLRVPNDAGDATLAMASEAMSWDACVGAFTMGLLPIELTLPITQVVLVAQPLSVGGSRASSVHSGLPNCRCLSLTAG